MTKDRDFKKLVRERMTKTGESYSTARMNLRRDPHGDPGSRSARRWQISFGTLFKFMMSRARSDIRLSPLESFVELGPETAHVQMGRAFRADIPLSSIISATPDRSPVRGRGVHGDDGKWLVNGSSKGIVKLRIEPACRADLTLGPLSGEVPLQELRVSLEEPAGFLRALEVARRGH
jgi:hypothetical protein